MTPTSIHQHYEVWSKNFVFTVDFIVEPHEYCRPEEAYALACGVPFDNRNMRANIVYSEAKMLIIGGHLTRLEEKVMADAIQSIRDQLSR